MLHILVQQGLEQSWTPASRDAPEKLDRHLTADDIDWCMSFEDTLSSCLKVSKGMCIGLFHGLSHFERADKDLLLRLLTILKQVQTAQHFKILFYTAGSSDTLRTLVSLDN